MTATEVPEGIERALELRGHGRAEEAAAAMRDALDALPDDAATLHAAGAALARSGAHGEAIELLQRAADLAPEDPYLQHNLGAALGGRGRIDDAIACYSRALELRPHYALAWKNLAVALQRQARLEEAIDAYRRAIALDPSQRGAYSNWLFLLNHSADATPEEVDAEHRRWAAQYADHRAAERWADDGRDLDPDRPLRVGYVSADLREHAVSFFVAPLLRAHDRAAVEVTCYAHVEQPDARTEELRALADHWRGTWGTSEAELARMVRDDGIDVLVDLAGHTRSNRLLTFAERPAPVQLTYLGYPNTTGLSVLDGRITDAIADPEGADDELCSEPLLRLPHAFLCYEPPSDAPDPAPRPGGPVVFGSFNKALKITPEVVALWARVLGAVPGSSLVLKSDSLGDATAARRLREAFAAHGVAGERLRLLPADASVAAHLARYAEVDIALDPFPYNGATTTCEALWQGVPVVALRGRAHAGRVSASILHVVGLDDLVAEDADGYVEVARALAANAPRRAELRSSLRERMLASPLCDADLSAREIEGVYRAAWRRFVASTPRGQRALEAVAA